MAATAGQSFSIESKGGNEFFFLKKLLIDLAQTVQD